MIRSVISVRKQMYTSKMFRIILQEFGWIKTLTFLNGIKLFSAKIQLVECKKKINKNKKVDKNYLRNKYVR